MARETELRPIFQCGECSTLFLRFDTQAVAGKIYELCPNCAGPRAKCEVIQNSAIWWLFNHILLHSGMSETRRMILRDIAESAMGPWHDSYRSL
jgi:hypothetical protein